MKIYHQHIQKHKNLRRKLLKLTSNTAKNLTLARQNSSNNVLLPKMHKTQIGARFIVASKNCLMGFQKFSK